MPLKAVSIGNFIALNAYIRKEESPQINDLSFRLKKLDKEEQMKSKVCRRKGMRIKVKIIKLENIHRRSKKLKSGSLRRLIKLNFQPN